MKKACLIAAMALLVTSPAHAGDCADATTQTEMDICADQAFKAYDATLNQLYRQIQARLNGDASAQKQLVTAQRAWVAFRNAECDFAASATEGGSIHPMIVSDCQDALTKRRIADFKAYLSCQEGDTTCPVPRAG
jgi:uncharacterized protein YecT (DUF1311 family)